MPAETSTSGERRSPNELPPQQLERRARILQAAKSLASEGGYDRVQMRDVADRAEVALGTLYRYFPSKVHLLVGLMQDETGRLTERLATRPSTGTTAAERVTKALQRGINALQRDPNLAEAMTRALMFADESAAQDVHSVTAMTTESIIAAMRGPDRDPTDDDQAIARVIEQVWHSSMLAWLSGRSTVDQVNEDIDVAARLLLR